MEFYQFDRDLSWLSFNERVLREAEKESVPLGERFNFLAIYSSNSDEFYRVRIPSLMGLHKIDKEKVSGDTIEKIRTIVNRQQELFGKILKACISGLDERHRTRIFYGQTIPGALKPVMKEYFFNQVMTYLQLVYLSENPDFFPENNRIYFAISVDRGSRQEMVILNIPSDFLNRFCAVESDGRRYIIFLDDIILENIGSLFPEYKINSCHSFKITRDAELDLKDEYEGDVADEIEKQLRKRDMGFATRFLYDEKMPESDLRLLIKALNLDRANQVPGGRYHNLKDFSRLPLNPDDHSLFYGKVAPAVVKIEDSIFDRMEKSDFMLHPPYHHYDTVLRFFNEAALDEHTSEIFVSLYRIAHDSHIAHALISAARNGKKVTVFVELKARFDEANNIHWAREMKAAGVKIIYSLPGLKVHAKIALVKRKKAGRMVYYGLLGTGNFNENTAKVYADHILFTANKELLREVELLFLLFNYNRRSEGHKLPHIGFHHLIISGFNMLGKFMELINFEIEEAIAGRAAAITVKLNNLEDKSIINRLYEASNAGVVIRLVVRGICCLVPGVKGMSENISVRRIVDRYLEHGRIFVFHHAGDDLVFSGSADWMTRNIYRRIEACFPVYDPEVRRQCLKIMQFYFDDNVQAVLINEQLQNIPVAAGATPVDAQKEIQKFISDQKE